MVDVLVERIMERGIRIYRFYKNTREAVDTYVKLSVEDFDAHVAAGRLNEPMFFVIDVSRSGMHSIDYMNKQIATVLLPKFTALNPTTKLPVNYVAYIAGNHSDAFMVNVVNATTRRELAHTRRVFKANELDKAIDWLIQQREQYDSPIESE